MLTLNFSPFPTLTTQRLVLRQLKDTDAPEIFFLRSDERILKYIDIPPAHNNDDALAFINKINKFIGENLSLYWGITLQGNDQVIGTICLWNINADHYRGEIGFVLHPDHWHKGYIQEAIAAVNELSFN